MLHLSGNILQWIGSGVAGLPDHRQRDTEFDTRGGMAPSELASFIKIRVDEVVAIIQRTNPGLLALAELDVEGCAARSQAGQFNPSSPAGGRDQRVPA